MKKCYIGVGGIGCRLLRECEKTQNEQNRFIYIDAVPDDSYDLGGGEVYALTNQKNGCAQRIVGKDEIKAIIYNGTIPDFVDDYFLSQELEVVFITTTFGGFGSAAAYELSDYYGVKIRNYRSVNDVKTDFICKVIAFPLKSVDVLKYAPSSLLTRYSTNEIEFINEFRNKEARNNKWYQEHSNCIPFVELYVPYSSEISELSQIIAMSDDDLKRIDIKKTYYIIPASTKNTPEVFISYSSQDQDVADMLVKVAKENGISCWIASSSIEAGSYAKQIVQGIKGARVFVVIVSESAILSPHVKNELDIATGRIKDGLIIMPFKIDASELDDECRYYLGRQEFFMGERPPIEERIVQFVQNIKKVFE
ncbi:MAG: toll/interleukin-1 receptor domain-containing protein [Clostridia bacterium]|nr:toll/interleukin-1 receptor domain-containing protein [Clostridia bacterium]